MKKFRVYMSESHRIALRTATTTNSKFLQVDAISKLHAVHVAKDIQGLLSEEEQKLKPFYVEEVK